MPRPQLDRWLDQIAHNMLQIVSFNAHFEAMGEEIKVGGYHHLAKEREKDRKFWYIFVNAASKKQRPTQFGQSPHGKIVLCCCRVNKRMIWNTNKKQQLDDSTNRILWWWWNTLQRSPSWYPPPLPPVTTTVIVTASSPVGRVVNVSTMCLALPQYYSVCSILLEVECEGDEVEHQSPTFVRRRRSRMPNPQRGSGDWYSKEKKLSGKKSKKKTKSDDEVPKILSSSDCRIVGALRRVRL